MTKRTKSPLVLAVVLLAIGFVVIAASADLSPAVASQDASTVVAVHSPMTSGHAEGSVFPAPVAMVLGVVGLSVIGFRLRKYA